MSSVDREKAILEGYQLAIAEFEAIGSVRVAGAGCFRCSAKDPDRVLVVREFKPEGGHTVLGPGLRAVPVCDRCLKVLGLSLGPPPTAARVRGA